MTNSHRRVTPAERALRVLGVIGYIAAALIAGLATGHLIAVLAHG